MRELMVQSEDESGIGAVYFRKITYDRCTKS